MPEKRETHPVPNVRYRSGNDPRKRIGPMEQIAKSPAAVQTTVVGAKQNVFPFEEVFPRPLAELILALNRDLGFPVDFSATAILTAFAAQ